MKKSVLFALVFMLAFVFSMNIAFAQPTGAPTSGISPLGGIQSGNLGQQGVTDTTSLVAVIVGLVNWVAWFVGLLAVLMGLYAGILFITAGGNAETVTQARNTLLYAIVGIAVAVLAFGLVAISRSIIGV